MTRRPALLTAALAVGALTITGCGSAEEDPEAGATPTDQATQQQDAPEATPEPEAAEESATPSADGDDADEADQTEDDSESPSSENQASPEGEETGPPQGPPAGGAPQAEEGDLAGEDPSVSYFGQAPAEVGVAGLDPEDAPVEVYALPGGDSEVVAELHPTDAVDLAGRERNLNASGDEGQSLWTEVQLADGYGWAEVSHFLYLSATEDVTEDYIEDVPPTQEPRALAESVGERATGGDPGEEDADADDYGPRWVVITEPEDFGEEFYRVDVTGAMSDSGAGHRYFVHVEQHADGYQLTEVRATAFCYRGVGDSGLCS